MDRHDRFSGNGYHGHNGNGTPPPAQPSLADLFEKMTRAVRQLEDKRSQADMADTVQREAALLERCEAIVRAALARHKSDVNVQLAPTVGRLVEAIIKRLDGDDCGSQVRVVHDEDGLIKRLIEVDRGRERVISRNKDGLIIGISTRPLEQAKLKSTLGDRPGGRGAK